MLRKRTIRNCFVGVVFLFLGTSHGNAQDDVDFQLWMNYALTVPIKSTKKFTYGGDVGLRGLVSNYDWNQVLIRPTATYRFNQIFSVALAMANFSTFNKNIPNLYEYRIHQDFNISWPDFGFLELFYRVRIEQRWFFYPNIPNNFNGRFRFLIGAESQDFRLGNGRRPIYFQVLFEAFRTLKDETALQVFINNTRTHFAFGHRISNGFRYELHYIWQKSRLFLDDGLQTTQNIFRIRFFHRLPQKED